MITVENPNTSGVWKYFDEICRIPRPSKSEEKIIEYMIEDSQTGKLADMSLKAFMEETASESPAPGGGSVSAAVGSLGVALGTMVANLSSHKRGWDERWEEFSEWADKGMAIQSELLRLVDEDSSEGQEGEEVIYLSLFFDKNKQNYLSKNAIKSVMSKDFETITNQRLIPIYDNL